MKQPCSTPANLLNRKISVAPMMEWTDRHCRHFLRLISVNTLLYTEMVTTGAILHGEHKKYLSFNHTEHPVAVQLGGSDPSDLAECSKICEDYGYDEVNLNVGCPSDRVQSGKIGACLMAEPELVASCVEKMKQATSLPVTVKHRIGIDDLDSYTDLTNFVNIVKNAGCTTFIVHARKAILSGLSPKENRQIPPLCYQTVYQLKRDYPELEIILNGGVTSTSQVDQHLEHVDGVMIGREAYHNPYLLSVMDERYFESESEQRSRYDIVNALIPYIEEELAKGARLQHISRHILGLFHARPRGKLWRRHLSENAYKQGAGISVIHSALKLIQGE